MKKYTYHHHPLRFLSDFHPTTPLSLLPQLQKRPVSGQIMFGEESTYEVCNNPSNQADWNKGGGLSHSLRPSYMAVMLGWRWYDNMWQLIPYINIKGGNYHSFEPFLALENVPIPFSINYYNNKLLFIIGTKCYFINAQTLPAWEDYKWSNVCFPRNLSFGGDDYPSNTPSIWWEQRIY